MKLRPPPQVGQEVYYVDSDKNLLRATVTAIHMGSFLRYCPTGTCWESQAGNMYIHVPEGACGDLKFPRGFDVDLEVCVDGAVRVIERVPYNPVEKGQSKKDSLASGSWIFA